MKKSPLAIVKERFQDKAGLVQAVKELASEDLFLDKVNADKGLEHASNKHLLHLHSVLTEVKNSVGSRDKLVDAICEQEKRTKDEGYKARLGRFSTPRLWDQYKSGKKRLKAAG